MISHLASLSDRRLVLSFAPKTPYYSVLKRIGELFPGPSKVGSCCIWVVISCAASGTPAGPGSSSHQLDNAYLIPWFSPRARTCTPRPTSRLRCIARTHPPSPLLTMRIPSAPSIQATRAYLHAEADVEAAMQRAGFKVVKREMTATSFYFSRLLEAVRV